MANCLFNLLRGIWSFILGSLRMILFFGCLIFVLVQLSLFMMLITNDPEKLDMPSSYRASFHTYLYAACMLFMSALGCYGSFYKHHPSLRAFAIMTGFSSVMLFFVVYSMTPAELEKQNDHFAKRMEDYFKDFSWFMKEKNDASINWNALQRAMCCGLKGPDDWDKYRPAGIPSDAYPSSCCVTGLTKEGSFGIVSGFCERNEVFKTGCMDRLVQIEYFTIMALLGYIGFQLFLCIVSCFVSNLNCNPDHQLLPTQLPRGPYPQEYQRFEGSVYVRQPAINPTHNQQPDAKHSPMYPNVRDYSSPPPSYGVSK